MQNIILAVQNNVLSADSDAAVDTSNSAVDRAVDRALSARRSLVDGEIRRLVEATFALIQHTGEIEPRVSQIVKAAGVSNQSFYKHFRSKHELLVAVLDEGVRILAGYLQHRMARVETPRERVREWLRGMLEQALAPEGAQATRPFALARGRLTESYPAEVARSEAQLTALVRAAIQDARDIGEFAGADPIRDAEALYHLTMGWVQARLLETDPPAPGSADALEAFALAALSRRGPVETGAGTGAGAG